MFGDATVVTQQVKPPKGSLLAQIFAPMVVPAGYQPPLPDSTSPAPTPEPKPWLYAGLALAALVVGGGIYLVMKEN
jgi:hypothetical protein